MILAHRLSMLKALTSRRKMKYDSKPPHDNEVHQITQHRWYILNLCSRGEYRLDCWGEEDCAESGPLILHVVKPSDHFLFTVRESCLESEDDCLELSSPW